MTLYSSHVFPWLLDHLLAKESFRQKRQELLVNAQGTILEIGIGTGLNLPEYPNTVKQITTVDVNPGMNTRAQQRAKQASIHIDHHILSVETLPFPDKQFDTIVSTWTLCSIPNIEQALQEIHRVLKPNGQLLFIEHGLNPAPFWQRWQHRLTPLWKKIGDGCHLDRDIHALITQAGFSLKSSKTFTMPKMTPLGGQTYQGIAHKNKLLQ